MKKVQSILIVVLAAVILAVAIVFVTFGRKTTKSGSTQTGEKQTMVQGEEGKTENTGTKAPEVELTEGKAPVYSKGKWKAVNERNFDYDLKVTTFNVGQFYHGVCNLDVYGAQKVNSGILPEYVMGAYHSWQSWIEDMESDIYGLQEFNPVFYVNTEENVTQNAKDVFAAKFKTLATCTGKTANDTQSLYMGIAAQNSSQYELTDIRSGYLSGKDASVQRPYLKGYTIVNGKRIAVFSVHLQPDGFGGKAARKDAIYELIELMNQEEYAIAMGDMNGAEVADYMREAGFHVANRGDFGQFNTYEYSTSAYIDNIFTTSNIDIQFVECEKKYQAGSDHYPLSAYLKIQNRAHDTGNRAQVGEDGFLDGWYRP